MTFIRISFYAGLLTASLVCGPALRADQDIYTDVLTNGWQDWSYRAAENFSSTATVHGGTKAISVTGNNYGALYLHTPAQDASLYTNLTFWINGGTSGGQTVVLQATLGGNGQTDVFLAALPTNSWRQITASMSALGIANTPDFDGISLQVQTTGTMPTFYVDDIKLTSGPPVLPGTNAPVTVQVDAFVNRQAISPLIYGVCFATSNQLRELNAPLNRSGGNATSRYNWQTNGSNHADDFYFESLAESGTGPGASGDIFIRESKNGGAQPMLTIPINGWVAKLGPNSGKLASFSIAKYGAQTGSDSQYMPDAGNGILASTGQPITDNDPTDANIAVTTNFQAGWIQHLTNTWGTATNGGLSYYLMDNEWGIWHSTHRDVWPVGLLMDQARERFCDYAAMTKSLEPNAIVLGPEEWGWTGYFYSGYDSQWGGIHGWSNLPDRTAHGGEDYLPWWLDQVHQRSVTTGKRLLDVFTLHMYPQGGEFSDDVSQSMQLRRNRSTRALWDTNYVDETWINDKVMLIPRMKAWVTNYPGTRIGITEYSWGADTNINGATAQADVLGILGREGLDLATRWTVPATGTPAYRAIQMYRNYDGQKNTFGHISVQTTVPNPDQLAAFTAVRTNDAALTVMVINKSLLNPTPAMLVISNFPAVSPAQVWRLTASNVITRLADTTINGGVISNLLPAQSITLYIVPASALRLSATLSPTNTLILKLDCVAGLHYLTQVSSNLITWQPFATNTPGSNQITFAMAATNSSPVFFRAGIVP